jgi:hypothetical protein
MFPSCLQWWRLVFGEGEFTSGEGELLSDVSHGRISQSLNSSLPSYLADLWRRASIPREMTRPLLLPLHMWRVYLNHLSHMWQVTFITWRGGKSTRPLHAIFPLHVSYALALGSSSNSLYKQASSSIVWLMGVWSWPDVLLL